MIFIWDLDFCCCLEMDGSLFHVGSPADFLENQFAEYWQRAMVQGIGHRPPLKRESFYYHDPHNRSWDQLLKAELFSFQLPLDKEAKLLLVHCK